MAGSDSNTKSGKRWSLLEQIKPGAIKENLIEIQRHLEQIERIEGILKPLADFETATDGAPSSWRPTPSSPSVACLKQMLTPFSIT